MPSKWNIRFLLIVSGCLAAVTFVNCSKSGDASNGNAQTETGAIVAEVDVFNPPLGDLVQGVTALDGWEPLRVLPAPVNIDGGWTDSVTVNSKGNRVYFALLMTMVLL